MRVARPLSRDGDREYWFKMEIYLASDAVAIVSREYIFFCIRGKFVAMIIWTLLFQFDLLEWWSKSWGNEMIILIRFLLVVICGDTSVS